MNYLDDVKIDESALDVEWVHQPALAIKWGVHWADCADKLATKEEALAILKADLIDKVNSSPEEYLGEGVKPTVGNIDSYIIRNKKYVAAALEVREARYALNVASVAKNEISNARKSALENLVKLHGQQYFAGPSIPRDLSSEVTKKKSNEMLNEKVGSKLKKRRTT